MPGASSKHCGSRVRRVRWTIPWALVLCGALEAAAADVTSGRSVYVVRCAPCHGVEGGGDGPAAAALSPKPRNFRDAAFWSSRGIEQVRAAVRDGRPGTMMAPFAGVLSDEEIANVVAFVETFRPAPH